MSRHPHGSSLRAGTSIAVMLLCSFAMSAACGDDDGHAMEADPISTDGGVDAGDADGSTDAAAANESCAGETDGSECGLDRHCIEERCVFNTCGDGVQADDEACDDRNEAVGDGCNPACEIEAPPGCGDGTIQDDEECDDGNFYDADECTNECTENVCGNERVDASEECDDGNLVNEDECSNECTENRCRNGRLEPGEECDDGNRIHDDGCTNACKIVICGNGKQEGEEECDDGNAVDDDSCAITCTANACGNGRIDPGEACDGDTVEYACADDCRGTEQDLCGPCEAEHCSDYLDADGFDVAAGCFDATAMGDAVRTSFGTITDPSFVQNCIDVVDCARRTGCGFETGPGIIQCYCGSAGVDVCQISGPAEGAPCVPEWQAATRGPNNTEVLLRSGDIAYPSGWAFYLLECDRDLCAEQCVP